MGDFEAYKKFKDGGKLLSITYQPNSSRLTSVVRYVSSTLSKKAEARTDLQAALFLWSKCELALPQAHCRV